MAVARSRELLQCSHEQNALHTLIRQRHPTPSCGERASTAERTVSPARMMDQSLTPDPELKNGSGVKRHWLPHFFASAGGRTFQASAFGVTGLGQNAHHR